MSKKTVKLLLIAEFEPPTLENDPDMDTQEDRDEAAFYADNPEEWAQQKLDAFRESVEPGANYGIVLSRATTHDMDRFFVPDGFFRQIPAIVTPQETTARIYTTRHVGDELYRAEVMTTNGHILHETDGTGDAESARAAAKVWMDANGIQLEEVP